MALHLGEERQSGQVRANQGTPRQVRSAQVCLGQSGQARPGQARPGLVIPGHARSCQARVGARPSIPWLGRAVESRALWRVLPRLAALPAVPARSRARGVRRRGGGEGEDAEKERMRRRRGGGEGEDAEKERMRRGKEERRRRGKEERRWRTHHPGNACSRPRPNPPLAYATDVARVWRMLRDAAS